jgi:hypothetical protein
MVHRVKPCNVHQSLGAPLQLDNKEKIMRAVRATPLVSRAIISLLVGNPLGKVTNDSKEELRGNHLSC